MLAQNIVGTIWRLMNLVLSSRQWQISETGQGERAKTLPAPVPSSRFAAVISRMPMRLMLAAASRPRSTSIQLEPRLHFNDQPPIVEHSVNLQTSPNGPNGRSEPVPDTFRHA
jgi:hypothetical protein